MYTLRELRSNDIQAVIDLAKSNQSRSRYSDLTYDESGAEQILRYSLTNDDVQVFVVTTDQDEVVGAIGALVSKMPWFKERMATEQFFALRPDHRGFKQAVMLLRAYKAWAIARGAVRLHAAADNADDTDARTVSLYKRVGFKPTGYSVSMRSE